ncbi:hypothetical protein Tco_0873644 [Tanacetum coccineum]|uniref:Uncharacterized protein n=1 Tax=Tanacetum coccineum TaxID=301880 RepID=A0ABQ5BMA8_9ASTR
MCMFALTVSTAEPKNFKEATADSAWIEAIQDELHQFNKLQVWELVDKPFGKTMIKLKWLWSVEVEMIRCSNSLLSFRTPHQGTPPSITPILYLHHLVAAELMFPRLTHRLGRDYYLPLPDLGRLKVAHRHHNAQKDRAAVRAEIEILRRERLAYEQESIQSRQDLARSEAYSRTLEARITVLETDARRHEWQRQAADDLAVQPIMHNGQAWSWSAH